MMRAKEVDEEETADWLEDNAETTAPGLRDKEE